MSALKEESLKEQEEEGNQEDLAINLIQQPFIPSKVLGLHQNYNDLTSHQRN